MGGGSYDSTAWVGLAAARMYDTKAPEEVINKSALNEDFLPRKFKDGIRESRDGPDNPRATPIIVAGDVTGSMGRLAGLMIKDDLKKFAEGLYDRKPVSNPHLMGMAIDDIEYVGDRAIQATQFEADIRILEQFAQLLIVGQGGGNHYESYSLAWIVAALMTRHDAWEKRGEKGIIFSYGDEMPTGRIAGDKLRAIGIPVEQDLTSEQALTMVRERYDVYHMIIEEGSYANAYPAQTRDAWTALLGQFAQPIADHTKMSEVMLSTLQLRAGVSHDAILKSWDGTTAVTVAKAIENLPVGVTPTSVEVVTL